MAVGSGTIEPPVLVIVVSRALCVRPISMIPVELVTVKVPPELTLVRVSLPMLVLFSVMFPVVVVAVETVDTAVSNEMLPPAVAESVDAVTSVVDPFMFTMFELADMVRVPSVLATPIWIPPPELVRPIFPVVDVSVVLLTVMFPALVSVMLPEAV
jgi:hypothetical protein